MIDRGSGTTNNRGILAMSMFQFLISGVVEGVEHGLGSQLVILAVEFGEAQVVTDQQATLDTVEVEGNEVVAGGEMSQVALGTEAFIVAVDDFAFRVYQVQAIVRFVLAGQLVDGSQDYPDLEFPGEGEDGLGFLSEQLPIKIVKRFMIGAGVSG